jgi:phosphate-selective porin OprO/OprP
MSSRWLVPAALAAMNLPLAAQASDTEAALRADVERLRAQLQLLESRLEALDPGPDAPPDAGLGAQDQRLRVLERKFEIQQEDALAKAPTTPVVALGDTGLSVRNAKGDFEFRLRGGLQFDQRSFFDDEALPLNDTSLFRRIRPSLEGRLGPLVAFRIVPELADDTASLIDATIDVKFDPRYSLRVGKLKGPVGLERLVSWNALALIERGFPTELAPSREIGAQLFGEFAGGTVNYAVGVFNGAPDGRNASASDPDNNVEFQARVFVEPWKNAANAWSGLGFGLAGSTGEKDGSGNAFLPRYRTPGQNVFFNYRTSVRAAGDHTRWTPQAYYYRNAFGLQAEYIESEQELLIPGAADSRISLAHSAWQLTGSWVLTGEDAGYRGVARPDRPFAIGGDGWGALELVARYGELDIDDDAFPRHADPATAASRSRAWGVGLNWFLTSNLKLQFNHTHARFDGGAAGGADREDERTFFSRVQVGF